MFRMPRELAMARAPYGPHTVTLILVVKGMVVGSPKIARARRARWPARWPALVSASCESRKLRSVFRRRRKRRARRAYRLYRTGPPPPLGWALPTVSSGWWRERAWRALVPSSPGLPSPRSEPPSLVNSPGEKTNLKQKQPSLPCVPQIRGHPECGDIFI